MIIVGKPAGGQPNFTQAIEAMTGVQDQSFTPNPSNKKIYNRLYGLYKRLHDAFGTRSADNDLYSVMKELLIIREEVQG